MEFGHKCYGAGIVESVLVVQPGQDSFVESMLSSYVDLGCELGSQLLEQNLESFRADKVSEHTNDRVSDDKVRCNSAEDSVSLKQGTYWSIDPPC